MFKNKWRLLSLALIGVIGIIAGTIYAAHHGGTEVRILGIRHDDGRVEVALQQANDDGTWGDRIRPEYRIIPAEVTGRWLHSSPVSVEAAHDDGMMEDSMSDDGHDHDHEHEHDDDAMPDVAMPEAPAELYCIIHHGTDSDPFWTTFNLVAQQNAAELGLTNVEISGEPDVADHAAAIDDCVDRGALGIASSIPELEGLKDSLVAARQSGAFLVTFNSGADVAGHVGSTIHYGLDDRSAGELAGLEFNEAGATGTVLCVIHEEVNIGLQDRCEGLESTYGGSVERVQLPAGSLTDPMVSGRAIGEALVANQAAGVLVLNAELINTAVGAVQFLQSDALVGAVGRSEESLVMVYEGQLLFAIADGSLAQASHVMLSLKNVDSSPSARAMLALTAAQAPETTTMLIRPLVLDKDYIDNLPPTWMDQVCALAMQFAPEQAPSFCEQ